MALLHAGFTQLFENYVFNLSRFHKSSEGNNGVVS